MSTSLIPLDPSALQRFHVVQMKDPREIMARSEYDQQNSDSRCILDFRLMDRSLLRRRFNDPITAMAVLPLGSMAIGLSGDLFSTQIDVRGDGLDYYLFAMMLRGSARLSQNGTETTAAGKIGYTARVEPGAQAVYSDLNTCQHFWLNASSLEHAFECMLDDRLRVPLQFAPSFDWGSGLAASLRCQIDVLIQDAMRDDGITANPVALASVTDLIVSLVSRGIPHNYSQRLDNSRCFAVPNYLRRAEEFMRANATAPLRMEQVANAAGCSIRTLGAVFRRFRDTTPLAALHAIRLDEVHAALGCLAAEEPISEVARRFGFTNAGRFKAAYCRRFGEFPRETLRNRKH